MRQEFLDGTDLSTTVMGAVRIEHEEDASSIATVVVKPATGSVDPDDYERKAIAISFVGKDSGGATLYTVRRFTGITSSAVYDPEDGLLTIVKRRNGDEASRCRCYSKRTAAGQLLGPPHPVVQTRPAERERLHR